MSAASDKLTSAPPARTLRPDGSVHYHLPAPTDTVARLVNGAAVALLLLVPLLLPLLLVPSEQRVLALIGASFLLALAAGIALWYFLTQLKPLLVPRDILVGRDDLLATTQLGPLRWTQRRSLTRIECLVIQTEGTPEADLLILSQGAAPLRLVQPLPLAQLRPFARDLAEQLTRLDPGESAAVEVREESRAVPTGHGQPAGSRIIVVEREGSLIVTMPPAGLRSGRVVLGLVGGALYLLGSLASTLWALYSIAVTGATAASSLETLPNLVFNWLLGACWLGYALHCCTRRIVLTVSRQGLHVEMVSLFRDSRRHWPRQELQSIRGEENGLYLHSIHGKSAVARWLTSADAPAENRWLAGLLWQHLQAAPAIGAGCPDDTLAIREDEP